MEELNEPRKISKKWIGASVILVLTTLAIGLLLFSDNRDSHLNQLRATEINLNKVSGFEKPKESVDYCWKKTETRGAGKIPKG